MQKYFTKVVFQRLHVTVLKHAKILYQSGVQRLRVTVLKHATYDLTPTIISLSKINTFMFFNSSQTGACNSSETCKI